MGAEQTSGGSAARTDATFFRGTVIAVAMSLALGGCAVGPEYLPPSMALPTTWSATPGVRPAAKPHLAHWWTRLKDRLLDQLIEEAVQGNLDVATAQARIREARATLDQSIGTLLPTARNTDSIMRQRTVAQNPGSGVSIDPQLATQYQAGFDSSWEIDIFGKNQRGVEAAVYGVDAADQQLRLALLTLVGDVAANYVAARGFEARLALARRTAAAQRETADLTRTRFEIGSASAVDLANASGQASSTEATIPSIEAAYAQAVHRLSVLLGLAPGDLMARMKRSAPIPRPRLPMPTGIPADVLVSRPDVLQAERLLAQATARIGQAEAARYPTVSLTGNISTTGLKIGDLGKNSTIGWSFGPTLSVPIFNGGQLRAAVEIQQARRDQNFIAYQAAVLKALEEVENAIVALGRERVRIAKLTAAVASYREAATLARSLYRGGSANFFTVLDAERSLYTAEDSLVQSRIALATHYIALNKALGGGWSGYLDVARPEVVDDMGPRLASPSPWLNR